MWRLAAGHIRKIMQFFDCSQNKNNRLVIIDLEGIISNRIQSWSTICRYKSSLTQVTCSQQTLGTRYQSLRPVVCVEIEFEMLRCREKFLRNAWRRLGTRNVKLTPKSREVV